MKYILLLGRLLFSFLFLHTVSNHFSPQTIAHAASVGLPMANILVPLSGVIAILGGLSIALGYKARLGGWLIVLFLIPVTFTMHAFWRETDPMQIQMQTGAFIKNLSLLGAAFYITYFGAGLLSIDALFRGTHANEMADELRKKKRTPTAIPEEFIKPR
ncbi:MAG: DoxX family protein [Chitinophagales bacterium]